MPAKVHSGRVRRVFKGFTAWTGEVTETGTRTVYPFEVPVDSFGDIPKKASVKFTLHPQPGPDGKRGKKLAKITRLV
ncbi:hypothetical protein KY335_03485 [Candidatus Woesearchaeota archaeon]|nr:hypothetical protein [Candidatus Woesearchaeota archaeon]